MTKTSCKQRFLARRCAENRLAWAPTVLKACGSLALLLGLTGCTTFSPDAGMGLVADVAGQELHKDVLAVRTEDDASRAHAKVERLLARPLSVDAAIQVALLNNRDLQASYNDLARAEAAMVGQSLPPNPTFSISDVAGPVSFEFEAQATADILALASLPIRSDIAAQRFRQAQLRAVEETLRLAVEVRRAYYETIAFRELGALLTESKATAEAAAKVATDLGKTGALNKLDQAREQVFYAEVTAELATARQQEASSREHLVRLLGLWVAAVNFKLPERLPVLPSKPRSLRQIETQAIEHRVDLKIGRIELEALARAYGLTQATRFINLLEVGPAAKAFQEPGIPVLREGGFTTQFQVPLFDFGEVRAREAEQTYMQAVNRLAARAVNIRSEARDAYRTYRSDYDIARHYQSEVLPLRKIITEEMQLRFSTMQVDVFALVTEAREKLASQRAAIEAKRNFWLAETALNAALLGGGSASDADTAGRTSDQERNVAER